MTPEEQEIVEEMRASLIASGYIEIEQHKRLKPGVRIRHRGHQWPEAYENGSGVVVTLMEKPDSRWSQSWGMPDVELIALMDNATFGSRLSQLAQYHVEVVDPS